MMSRDDAREAGLKRFDPGMACVQGHTAPRYVSSGRCVECVATNRKKFRAEKPEHVRQQRRMHDAEHRDAVNSRAKNWRDNNKQKAIESVRRWREKNKEKIAAYQRCRREKFNEWQNARRNHRKSVDPLYALEITVRSRIGRAIRRSGYRKSGRTAEIIGCSWPELKRHIERQFLKGMTWENRGSVWHVDHIHPIGKATSKEELLALCHFTNLRPLWAEDNWKKNAKRLYLI